MYKTFSLLAIAFLSLFAFTAHAQSSGKLSLSNGEKLVVENNMVTVSNMEMMGQTMEVNATASMKYNVEVKQVQPEKSIVNSTLVGIKINTSAMGQENNFDSDKKEDMDGELGKMLGKQINKSIEAEIDSKGKVLNLKKEEKKEQDDSNGSLGMLSGMGAAGEDASNGANLAFLIIPANSKKGDTWTDSTANDGNKTNYRYTIQDIVGKTANININGVQTTVKKVEQMGMELTVNMDAVITGDAAVNMESGVIIKKNITMDGKGSMDMMGQAVPMTNKVTITTVVTK